MSNKYILCAGEGISLTINKDEARTLELALNLSENAISWIEFGNILYYIHSERKQIQQIIQVDADKCNWCKKVLKT
jgi:hypothetical protein